MAIKELAQYINGVEVVLDLGRVALKGNKNRAERRAVFKCNCGNDFNTSVQSIKSGATTSCGCYHKKIVKNKQTTHGMTKTRLFSIWQNMKNRCNNKNSNFYHRYGGRGIKVCHEWSVDFIAFYSWANSSGYLDTLTIDRINNDLGYEPSNCQWISKEENSSKDKKGKSTNPNIKLKIEQIKIMLNDGISMNQIIINMKSSKYLIRKIKEGYNG